jgi:hypothetical protein
MLQHRRHQRVGQKLIQSRFALGASPEKASFEPSHAVADTIAKILCIPSLPVSFSKCTIALPAVAARADRPRRSLDSTGDQEAAGGREPETEAAGWR